MAELKVRRRSCAALAKYPDRDTELLGLVGKIRRDARAWEDDDSDREDVENPVVALERGSSGVSGLVRLEDDLRHLAGVGPAGGDTFGALGAATMQQHHVGMLGVDLVELVPDQAMVVEIESAREGDLGTGGQEHLGLGAALGGEKIAAVDHRRGEVSVIDHRARMRAPR